MTDEDKDIRDALRAALDIMENHPPTEVRGPDRPHNGELDCAVCSYPLTGCVRAGMPKHEDYRKPTWRSGSGERCDYIVALEQTRAAIKLLDDREERENQEPDIVTALGRICLSCGQGDK